MTWGPPPMGFIPPTSPVVRRMSASDNPDRIMRELRDALDDWNPREESLEQLRERVERNLAATGREPLPSEQKILGQQYGSKPRKITLE